MTHSIYALSDHLWYPSLRTILIIDHTYNGKNHDIEIVGSRSTEPFTNIFFLPGVPKERYCWNALLKIDPQAGYSSLYGCWFLYNQELDIACLMVASSCNKTNGIDKSYFIDQWTKLKSGEIK